MDNKAKTLVRKTSFLEIGFVKRNSEVRSVSSFEIIEAPKEQEKIECINPVYLTDRSDIDKLNDLTSKLEEMFQVGVD